MWSTTLCCAHSRRIVALDRIVRTLGFQYRIDGLIEQLFEVFHGSIWMMWKVFTKNIPSEQAKTNWSIGGLNTSGTP